MATDPCSYLDPTYSKTICQASGHIPNFSDPCDVLNPGASATLCAATANPADVQAAASARLSIYAIGGIVIGAIVLLILIFALVFGSLGAVGNALMSPFLYKKVKSSLPVGVSGGFRKLMQSFS